MILCSMNHQWNQVKTFMPRFFVVGSLLFVFAVFSFKARLFNVLGRARCIFTLLPCMQVFFLPFSFLFSSTLGSKINFLPICSNPFSQTLLVEDYSWGNGSGKNVASVICVRGKIEHKHMTMRRYGSTLSAGEIKFAFLFSGRWPHAAGAPDGGTGGASIMLHQNVIKHRSISNIRLILYHHMLIPT